MKQDDISTSDETVVSFDFAKSLDHILHHESQTKENISFLSMYLRVYIYILTRHFSNFLSRLIFL